MRKQQKIGKINRKKLKNILKGLTMFRLIKKIIKVILKLSQVSFHLLLGISLGVSAVPSSPRYWPSITIFKNSIKTILKSSK